MAGNVGAVVAGVRAAKRRQHMGSVNIRSTSDDPSVLVVEYPPRLATQPQQQKVGRGQPVGAQRAKITRKVALPLPFRRGMESLYAARFARELEEVARKRSANENPFCFPEDLSSEASASTVDTTADQPENDPIKKFDVVVLEPTEPFARYLGKVLGRGSPVTGIFYQAPGGKPGLTRFEPENCRRLPFVNGMLIVACFKDEEPVLEFEEELLRRQIGSVSCGVKVPGCTIL